MLLEQKGSVFLFVKKYVSSMGYDVGIFPLKEQVLNLFSDGFCDENAIYSSLPSVHRRKRKN